MLKMKTNGALWDCSVDPPKPIDFIGSEIPLEKIGESPNKLWFHVRAHFPLSVEPLICCVVAAEVVEDIAEPASLNVFSFLKYCTMQASIVNMEQGAKEYGLNRDYLIALASVLSDLRNVAAIYPGSDAFGPFQITKQEWENFRSSGDHKDNYSEIDRLDPLLQVDAAAFNAFEATRGLSLALTDEKTGSGPYVPDSIDLFLVHMVGLSAAVAALKADRAGAGAQQIADVISRNGGDVGGLKERYPRFLGVSGHTTIDQVQALIEAEFDAALNRAFALLRDNTPEELPAISGGGRAPWLDVARKEQAKGIAEPNKRILDYFKAIKFKTNTTRTPWCGAFVGFCIRECDDAKAASSVRIPGAALAATWKNWGVELPTHSTEIPAGAVVVLSPTEHSDTSGHVAFFVSGNVNSITLLGGNQSDSVKESTYRRSQVVAVRWLDVTGGPNGAGARTEGQLDLSIVSEDRRPIANLILTTFASAGFGLIQQAAALANAIAESNLDPNSHATHGEDSVGLFQLNRAGGLGAGHTVQELKDPKKNCAIIIEEAKRFSQFAAATSVDDAVAIFVRKVERPANPASQIIRRVQLAKQIFHG